MPTCLPLDCCNESDLEYSIYDQSLIKIGVVTYAYMTPGPGTVPSGTVTGDGLFSEGDTVTLTATPDIAGPDPSKLYGWFDEAGNRISDDNPFVFTATVPRVITCAFALI